MAGDTKVIQQAHVVARYAGSLHRDFGPGIVQAWRPPLHIAHTGEIAHLWELICWCQQGAMHGHGLRCIFNSGADGESVRIAQWVVQGRVAVGVTLNFCIVPVRDRFEQAHGALVWNVALNPGAVDFHALFRENNRLQLLPPNPKELLSAWVIASSWFARM